MITTMQESLKYAREQALVNMKNSIEIKRLVNELIGKVEKEFKK